MRDQPDHIIVPQSATTPQLCAIAKAWAKTHIDLPAPEFEKLITALIHSPSSGRKCMAGILLGYMPTQRRGLDPALYEDWLEHTEGWAAIDAICYNNFTAAEMLDDLTRWKTLIHRLAKRDNLNQCRGAIVLLTKPVKQSNDPSLSKLSFQVIGSLQTEKSILITKAVSWLLRHLVRHHASEVKKYLDTHQDTLPAIAIRETRSKLKHGTKSSPKKTL
jgi:3-methyladenine DNA glycosylase AlkD